MVNLSPHGVFLQSENFPPSLDLPGLYSHDKACMHVRVRHELRNSHIHYIYILPKPRAYLVLDYFSCKQFLEEMIVVWANMEVCDAQIENYTLAVLTINCYPKTMLTMGLSAQFT